MENLSTTLKSVPEKKPNECVIATINIRTLSNDIKLGSTYDIFKSLRHDICCYQETKRTGQGILQHDDTQFIWSGHKRKKSEGVGIMLSKNVKLIDISYINERILNILVKVNNIKTSITNCYAPTNCANDNKKDLFYRNLQKCIDSTPKQYKNIIIGDFNATIGEESFGFWQCLGPTNNKMETNNNGHRLLKFSENNNMRLENSIRPSTKGEKRINTWVSPTGFEKRLDYILTSQFIHKYVNKFIVRPGSSEAYETDHLLL